MQHSLYNMYATWQQHYINVFFINDTPTQELCE